MAQTKAGALLSKAKTLGITVNELVQLISMGLKRCTKCKYWRDVKDFGSDSSRGDGVSCKCTPCRVVKIKKTTKGRVSTFKGHRHTDEARRQISQAKKGQPSQFKGKPRSYETRLKISEKLKTVVVRGEDHRWYKHGKTPETKALRASWAYKNWRQRVFSRDCFTCQHCGDNRGGNLHAHHIKTWADCPDLRFELNNGLTLCIDCHERVHLLPMPQFKARRKKHPMPK